MRKSVIASIHLLIIITAWSSPLWLGWKTILILYLFYLLQNFMFGRCLLSKAQFGNEKESFYSYYLQKAGIKWKREHINLFVDYILPPILIFLSFIIHSS